MNLRRRCAALRMALQLADILDSDMVVDYSVSDCVENPLIGLCEWKGGITCQVCTADWLRAEVARELGNMSFE